MECIFITDAERETLIARMVEEIPVLRLKIGMSQDEMASLLDISRQTYSSIENKKRKMTWRLYLSLVLIFYHNELTHDYLVKNELFPKRIIHTLDTGAVPEISSFVQLDRGSIRNHLDEQALHAIETVIMMEYARCNNISGEAVIKAFDGKRLTQVAETDTRIRDTLERIKAGTKDMR